MSIPVGAAGQGVQLRATMLVALPDFTSWPNRGSLREARLCQTLGPLALGPTPARSWWTCLSLNRHLCMVCPHRRNTRRNCTPA